MFIPHTNNERKEMLASIGKNSINDLFEDVPEQFRYPDLDLPDALSEMEALDQLQELSNVNASCDNAICFLGAGAYDHYIPAAVDYLIQRGEFFTAYTPYQPEISQGTLQAIFEYQSLISSLTGMEACNASHYDGATAAAEACITAYHNFKGKRKKVILSPSLNPQYRSTIRTYLSGFEGVVIQGDEKERDLYSSPDALIDLIDENTSLVMIQYPDFFGRIFNLEKVIQAAHEKGALVAVSIYPIALGLFKSPGEYGADIVVGEGQSLGIPLSFGGPYLGLFACRKELIRKTSGRIVGETVDRQDRRGYVLTLTTREQHIRREKATSNICTNESLMALASTIYLSLLGKHGLRHVSELCFHKAHYASEQINKIKGYSVIDNGLFFNEFVVKCPKPVNQINDFLLTNGFIGGLALDSEYPELNNHMLIAVTEKISRELIDLFCQTLTEAVNV